MELRPYPLVNHWLHPSRAWAASKETSVPQNSVPDSLMELHSFLNLNELSRIARGASFSLWFYFQPTNVVPLCSCLRCYLLFFLSLWWNMPWPKQFRRERVQGTIHYGGEVKAIGTRSSWSHCICRRRKEQWMLELTPPFHFILSEIPTREWCHSQWECLPTALTWPR